MNFVSVVTPSSGPWPTRGFPRPAVRRGSTRTMSFDRQGESGLVLALFVIQDQATPGHVYVRLESST